MTDTGFENDLFHSNAESGRDSAQTDAGILILFEEHRGKADAEVSKTPRRRKARVRVPDVAYIVSSTGRPVQPSQISFDRRELNAILRIYGFKVADGEWRDYAIDHLKDRAIFSVYRRASESALFRIEKNPKLASKQGIYSVISHSGQILKRGHDLRQVLRVFEKRLKLVD